MLCLGMWFYRRQMKLSRRNLFKTMAGTLAGFAFLRKATAKTAPLPDGMELQWEFPEIQSLFSLVLSDRPTRCMLVDARSAQVIAHFCWPSHLAKGRFPYVIGECQESGDFTMLKRGVFTDIAGAASLADEFNVPPENAQVILPTCWMARNIIRDAWCKK